MTQNILLFIFNIFYDFGNQIKKQSRYIILFFNEDPFNFSFFKPDENIVLTRPLDLDEARNLLIEDERIEIPLITKGKYSVIGILKENQYFTLRATHLLAHLQRNRLIYGTYIQKNSIIGYSCLFTNFKEALINNYHIESPIELSKIKNYLSLKSSDSDIEYYIMQVLLSPLSLNDSLLINIKKKEYTKLINGFIKKI